MIKAINPTKRYPHSRAEDIVDAYMRGWNDALDAVQNNKFVINDDRKTEPRPCEECKHYLFTDIDGYYCEHETYGQPCHYEPKDEPQTDKGIGCSRCEGRLWCDDRDRPNAVYCNNYGKTEPQTDCAWK